MTDLALAVPEVPGTAEPGHGRALFGEDRAWLALLATVTAIELARWTLAWSLGHAPGPLLLTYLGAAFGADPWLILDHLFGWAAAPLDGLYALWLPTQVLLLFLVIVQPALAVKSRVLIAYALAWFMLGMVAATLLSSAGPIFHDRVFGGDSFAALHDTLRKRGAWMVLAESNRMWASLASARPGLVAGISAVPSIHVAVSVWMFLAARTMAPRAAPYAAVYATLIWIGSVQLGWHYVSDGVAGALGMLAIWAVISARVR